ncbi:MAG TPA: PAS domain-containing protein, partial [Stellaceae bacterium]|nr:PAS domain-containing protein [Stellaceae bacterium]
MTMQPAIRRQAPRAAGVLSAAGLPAWMRSLAAVAVGSAVLGLGLLFVALTALPGDSLARPLAIVLILVAASCGLAVLVARQVHAALAGRVDLLNQALEASPNGHLVVAPDGLIAYANAAFHRFFPELGNPPLDAIARRFTEDEGAAREFLRLRQDAARSGRAAGRLALRYGAGSTAWFSVSAHLLAGRPGYGLWSFEDVTARHEMEQVIRDEQMKLADFLDHAPIGFYSVDGEGRFLFVNQALADWLGASAGELVESGARLKDFLAGEVPSGSPAHAPFEGGAAGAARGEVV